MFENKKYVWLLTELAKRKMKLKILEIVFLGNKEILAHFESSEDGCVKIKGNKNGNIKEVLEKFLQQRIGTGKKKLNGLVPILYLANETSKKLLNKVEVKWLIKKGKINCYDKEVILFQEHLHCFSSYFVMELRFDGIQLECSVFRMDCDRKGSVPDDRYYNLTASLNTHLVSSIEKFTEKNVVRLKYEFIIDTNFCLWIMKIRHIKLAHPNFLAANKGLSIDILENSAFANKEYKNLAKFIPSRIKHPDSIQVSQPALKSESSTKIFMKFVANFLESKKKSPLKTSGRSLSQVEFEKPGLKLEELTESGFIESTFKRLASVKNQPVSEVKKVEKVNEGKLPKIRVLSNCLWSKSRIKEFFPSLQPSPILGSFLKSEEERIMGIQSRRLGNSEGLIEFVPNSFTIKKLKRVKKKKISEKSIPKLLSPYRIIQYFK